MGCGRPWWAPTGYAPAPLLTHSPADSVRCACTGRCAVIAVIGIIIALDYDDVYAHLGSNAPNRLLILDERYRHIMTWRPGVGLYLSKAGARIRWNWRRRLSRGAALDGLYASKAELQVELEKKTVDQLRQQCKDQGLSVSGSEHELVQRLLAATEAEDDLQTWVAAAAAAWQGLGRWIPTN